MGGGRSPTSPSGGVGASEPEPARLPGIGGLFAGGFPQLKKAGGAVNTGRRDPAPAISPGKTQFHTILKERPFSTKDRL